MEHRHLDNEGFSLAAIDDIIDRGLVDDWLELREAMLVDRALAEKILRVCEAHVQSPYAQRYHFWKHYAQRFLA